jgi:hypothetical protein
MDRVRGVLRMMALGALVIAALPTFAHAGETFKDVIVRNTDSAPVPTRAIGTTAVAGEVSVANTPSVNVANSPAVSLQGSDNLVRSADTTEVVLEADWEHDGGFLSFSRGAFVNQYKTIRFLIARQGPCSTDVEYELSATLSVGAARSVVLDEGFIPAASGESVHSAVFEMPGNIVSVEIRAGTPGSPCHGGVIVVGRRN